MHFKEANKVTSVTLVLLRHYITVICFLCLDEIAYYPLDALKNNIIWSFFFFSRPFLVGAKI